MEVRQCRICGNAEFDSILNLGSQALTGVFPATLDTSNAVGPLELVKCREDHSDERCGLVQLRHRYEPEMMYGRNYGYRSGLNSSIVGHLQRKAQQIQAQVELAPGDLVLDIGSNDGTLLAAMRAPGVTLAGMDPTAEKFRRFYPLEAVVVPDFFSAARFRRQFGARKAKVVTSIAMFYDLDAPLEFMREVADLLSEDGIWVVEQSYLPTMLARNSYDTVCHEHQEYYALRQMQWLVQRAGLKILDVELNDINGGSFSIVIAKEGSERRVNKACLKELAAEEARLGLAELQVYRDFADRATRYRDELRTVLGQLHERGAKVFGYGASTKGNVILQYCGITARELPCIAEVNPDKFGCYTPGTNIPIVSEAEAHRAKPDAFLVLPWHFRENIVEREAAFLASGGILIFPLPACEIVALTESYRARA
jgi:NDP-4-keto-2,6-dideoxyhexose 3-C-methyltransferase